MFGLVDRVDPGLVRVEPARQSQTELREEQGEGLPVLDRSLEGLEAGGEAGLGELGWAGRLELQDLLRVLAHDGELGRSFLGS